ncbi:MAG TPA: outer membrane protein assembly factor BamD [Gallionellaceae bacterium]|nr:outer membrane protein assembly factor BamD [Gallionellaceae bacterium]
MRYSLALILLLSLTGCGTTAHSLSDGDSKGPAKPAGDMYKEAMADMKDRSYDKASKVLKSLLSRYPYGYYSQQAQMELAYAYYKQPDPESALSAVNTFIKEYPTSPHLDYIYYLKGLIHFYPSTSFFRNIAPNDRADTDPENVEKSFEAFKQLVTRFPNSIYAPNARLRMQYLANTLARHELKIAHYYMRRGAYVAAVSRAKDVVVNFSDTPQTIDALRVMVVSYDQLGLTKLRDDTQRILDLNTRTSPAAASAPAAATPDPAAQTSAELAPPAAAPVPAKVAAAPQASPPPQTAKP